jgi:hypothetical protein
VQIELCSQQIFLCRYCVWYIFDIIISICLEIMKIAWLSYPTKWPRKRLFTEFWKQSVNLPDTLVKKLKVRDTSGEVEGENRAGKKVKCEGGRERGLLYGPICHTHQPQHTTIIITLFRLGNNWPNQNQTKPNQTKPKPKHGFVTSLSVCCQL